MREIANVVLVFLLNMIASRGAPSTEARPQHLPECTERTAIVRSVEPPLIAPPPMLLTAPRPAEAIAPVIPCSQRRITSPKWRDSKRESRGAPRAPGTLVGG